MPTMKHAWFVMAAMTLAGTLGVTGCSDTAGHNVGQGPTDGPVADATPAVAAPITLSRGDTRLDPIYATVENTGDLFSRLDDHTRGLAAAFYGAYSSSVMQFARKQQLDWMISNGYPMPDDIAEAERLADSELLAQFQQGDTVAGFLYYDRRISQLLASADPSAGAHELDELQYKLIATGSPFAGYAIARRHMELDGDLNAAMAGLGWADFRGDHRAGLEMMRLIEIANGRKPGRVDPGALLFSVFSLQKQALMVDPRIVTEPNQMPWDSDGE